MTRERDAENLFEQELKSQGWCINVNDSRRNVYHQCPKFSADRKKLRGRSPDFCLYLSPDAVSPEVIAETKKPGMNLSKTKQQALDYAKLLDAKIMGLA
ncbi:MAG: hypothetical protein LBT89_02755 [Planctomycetaceae bacterium]|jgi:type I restriction enzyme M protein|nr:hypothetical protein [Planctomycetaceae bacterium]